MKNVTGKENANRPETAGATLKPNYKGSPPVMMQRIAELQGSASRGVDETLTRFLTRCRHTPDVCNPCTQANSPFQEVRGR